VPRGCRISNLGGDGVSIVELAACRLKLRDGRWDYQTENRTAIEANWEMARSSNSKLFNGDVFIVEDWKIEAGVLEARLVQTKFAAYLYWRGRGFHDGRYDEAFATTAVFANDGGMLVARAVEGTLNEGHYVSPGGLIDARDLGRDGLIDPGGAAVRELAEETGLTAKIARRRPGFLLARDAPYLALASVFDVAVDSAELLSRVRAFIDHEAAPELLDPMILRRREDIGAVKLTTPTRLIAAHLLD